MNDEHEDDVASEVQDAAPVETESYPNIEDDLQDEPDEDEPPAAEDDPSEL